VKIADSMLDLIGNIPLVRLQRIGADTGSEILVKPEYLNPSGSIKDRIAKRMVEAAEAEGLLHRESTIIEATTGNTGTALAFVAAIKGYRMVAYSPQQVTNRSRSAIMLAYGSQMETVEAEALGVDGRSDSSVHGGRIELLPRQMCLELESGSEQLWWARQFSNPQNAQSHRDWTAQEILDSTDGVLDAFVASVGTGGTLLGVAQALKALNPEIWIVGVEPAGSPILGAPDDFPIVPGISDGIIPEILESGLVDQLISLSDEQAIQMAHKLAKREGIFCGMSSGANVEACLQVARELGPGKRIVTVLPDSRDRYLEVEKYTT
jgi:cysteine synthase